MRSLALLCALALPVPGLAGTLTQALSKAMIANPTVYLEEVTALIAGFGDGVSIDQTGLDHAVALQRAAARAVALNRLQGADLDADGSVSMAEIAVVSAAASASGRGRLAVSVMRADADGDGAVTAVELQGHAMAAGYAAFDDAKVADLRAVLKFDRNADGRVNRDEVKAGLATLAQASAAKPKKIPNQLDVQRRDGQRNGNRQAGEPVRCDKSAHLGAVGGEHNQGNHGKAELQAQCDLGQDQQFARPL